MKKLAIVVAILAAAALITPKFIAHQAQETLLTTVSEMNDITGYNVSVVAMKSGWFGSTSTINVELDFEQFAPAQQAPAQQDFALENIAFDVILDMNYGPLLLASDASVGQLAWQAHIPVESDKLKFKDTQNKDVYRMTGSVGLFGALTLHDVFPAFTVNDTESGLNIDFAGYEGNGETIDGELQYFGAIPSFVASGDGFSFNSESFTIKWQGEFDYLAALQGKYHDTDAEFVFEKLSINDGQTATVEGLSFFANSVVDDAQLMTMKMGYKVAALNSDFINLHDIAITMSMNNLSAELINTYQENVGQLATMTDIEEIKALFAEPVAKAMNLKPTFSIDNIGFKHDAGEFTSQALVSFDAEEVKSEEVFSPEFWKQHLNLDSSLSLPVSMFENLGQKYVSVQLMASPQAQNMAPEQLQQMAAQQTEGMMQGLIQQGLLVQDGDELQLSFKIKEQQAELNSNVFPLEHLFPAGQ